MKHIVKLQSKDFKLFIPIYKGITKVLEETEKGAIVIHTHIANFCSNKD